MQTADDLDVLRDALLAEITAKPVTRRWWRDAVNVAAVTLGVAFIIIVTFGWSRHPRQGALDWWLLFGVLGLIAVTSSWAAFRPAFDTIAVWLASALAVVAIAGIWMVDAGDVLNGLWADADCAVVEAAASLPAAWVAVHALQRFAFRPAVAWAAGLGAGTSGMLVLHATCPVGASVHALAFHVAPWIVVSALVVFIRSRAPSHSAVP